MPCAHPQTDSGLTDTFSSRGLGEVQLLFLAQQINVLRQIDWTGGGVAHEKNTIHLRETKTGVQRYVQLSDQATDFLKVLRLTSDKYLFSSQVTKKPIQQKYLTKTHGVYVKAVKCLIYLIGRPMVCYVQYGQGYAFAMSK